MGRRPVLPAVDALMARTEELTEKFLQIWHRPGSDIEDSEDLVPILDPPKNPGWYPGRKTEFEYVKFLDETWEVHDVKILYKRVFKRLWSTHRPAVLDYSTSRKGPIFETEAWESQWDGHARRRYQAFYWVTEQILPRFGTEGSKVQILSPRPIPKKFAKFSLPVHSVPPANSRRRTECSALQTTLPLQILRDS
jgi:hypothetical protein